MRVRIDAVVASMEVEEKIAARLHPPECPKCGEKVDYLDFSLLKITNATFKARLHLTENGVEYFHWTLISSDGTSKYLCRKCRALLANDIDGAVKFLKGEE